VTENAQNVGPGGGRAPCSCPVGANSILGMEITNCSMMVKMLLEREGVDPDRAETINGRTPVLWAAEMGHKEVVGLPLTPLWWTALHPACGGILLE